MEINWTCIYCERELLLKSKFTKSAHLSRCKKWKKWKDENLSKDFLYLRYVTEKKSLPQIANEFSLPSVTTIVKLLKSYNIPLRSSSEAWNLSNEKRKKTFVERYGSDSILYKNHPKRLLFEAELLNKYGVLNVFQLKEVKEKIKNTFYKKYGVSNPSLCPEIRQKQLETFRKKYGLDHPIQLMKAKETVTFSKIHRKVYQFLIDSGYSAKIEKYLNIEGARYFFDIYFENIPSKLIEVNGDYYHASPEKYKPNDYFKIKNMTASQIWDSDAAKILAANKAGYDVLVVWETEINKNFDSVKEKVLRFINEVGKNKVD